MQSAQANAITIPCHVLYVGRLSPEKGVDVLLRAWSILLHSPSLISEAEQTVPSETPASERGSGRSAGGSIPTATASTNHSLLVTRHLSLTIVGDGPERPSLESLTATLGISNSVKFAGALTRDAARDVMSSASLLVLPSICYETFGLAIVEAASLGVPAIVTAIGGQATLVQDGVTGRHVPPGDSAALTSALQDLLFDPVALHSMGEAAHVSFETSECIPYHNLAILERVYASCARPSPNHHENHG